MAKKRLQRWLAFCLALSMLMGTTALAVDGTEYIENEDGTTTQQTVATEVKTDPESGKPTVVVTIEEKINEEIDDQINPDKDDNKTNDGVVVDLDAKRTEEYEFGGTDEDGNPIKGDLEHYVDEGTETREWTEKDDGSKPGQPPVTVQLEPGKPTSSTSTSQPTTTGDTDKTDGEWHYTKTTTTDRTVTANTSDVTVKVNDADTGLVGEEKTEMKPWVPVYDEEDPYIYYSKENTTDKTLWGRIYDKTGKEDLFDRNYLGGESLDRVVLENGIIIWVNDSDKIITNIDVPEGVAVPENFDYTVGMNVIEWYQYTKNGEIKVAGDPQTGKLPEEVKSNQNNIVINDIANWYDTDRNLLFSEDGEFMLVGTGEHGKFYNARVEVIYKKQKVLDENGEVVLDENGNPKYETVYDENGKPVIEALEKRDGTIITIDGVPTTELPDEVSLKPIFDDYNGGRPKTFMLMDKNGNKVYAYCCDMETGTAEGTWYTVANLEDSNYYGSEASEEHIRSIVMNGYWGTSDTPKADGTYEDGSLEKIKQNLKNAINNGEMANETVQMPKIGEDGKAVVDENGNPVMETKTMLELIDDMTEGEALLATQSAIWAYSNGHVGALNGVDGTVVIDPDGYKWNQNPSSDSKDGEALDDYGSARVDFLYKWLIGLETNEESTVVINEDNFVKDLSLTVGDKAEGFAQNEDNKDNNDVYNTSLNFKLAFVPSEENDDLLVQVTYTDLDGVEQTIVKRLAGENSEGQSFEKIQPNEDGSYVIPGLKLSENEDFAFDLRLEGTQYLENGVYVYAPVGGRDVSQTFVGVAEGERNVDVSLGVTVSFDVDEDNHVRAKREWREEGPDFGDDDDDDDDIIPGDDDDDDDIPKGDDDDDDTPKGDDDDDDDTEIGDDDVPQGEFPSDDDDDDTDNIPEDDVPLEELPEDDVPLAEVPKTGDASVIWFALSALSGAGLVGLNLTKKREDEE